MLRELLSILRSDNPLAAMGENFVRMIKLAHEMTFTASDIFFGRKPTLEDRRRIYDQDIQVNQLERAIRKQVVAHLCVQGNTPHVPYCLLLMSLVKDVERLGDYAKNLSELADFCADQLPDDEIVNELRVIRRAVEEAFKAAAEVFATSDRERAVRLIREGRDIAHRSDALIERIARANYDASTTTALALGTRYYKRIGGHLLNVLSSVVMPVHKVDYFDEDEIASNRK
ncbi:MAG: PhoU domain-containing protein [Bacteroidota bacterium]